MRKEGNMERILEEREKETRANRPRNSSKYSLSMFAVTVLAEKTRKKPRR